MFFTNSPQMPTINSMSPESIGIDFRSLLTTVPASAAWPAANRAVFVPFTVTDRVTVTALFSVNGASASNNEDIGIYAADGTKIVSTGSTARSGTNTLQVIDITDTTIGPGLYYMALAQDNTTGSHFSINIASAITAQRCGVYNQSSAFPLPATATFASATTSFIPVFGLIIGPRTTA